MPFERSKIKIVTLYMCGVEKSKIKKPTLEHLFCIPLYQISYTFAFLNQREMQTLCLSAVYGIPSRYNNNQVFLEPANKQAPVNNFLSTLCFTNGQRATNSTRKFSIFPLLCFCLQTVIIGKMYFQRIIPFPKRKCDLSNVLNG